MDRLYLNPSLRYQGPLSLKKNGASSGVANEYGPDEEDQPFSPEEQTWLTNATMPVDTQNAIIVGESAYLIYREFTTKGEKPILEPLRTEEIVRLESNVGYCYVYLQDNSRYLLAMSLKWVSHYLSDFIRIHRTHAVNPIFVKQYLIEKEIGQKDRYLLLNDDTRLPWSRRHLRERRQDSPHLFNIQL